MSDELNDSGGAESTPLKKMRAMFTIPFPGCLHEPSIPFGVARRTFRGVERVWFHHGVDEHLAPDMLPRYREWPVVCPGDAVNGTAWYGEDAEGTTWLDLKGDGWTFRFAHIYRHEILPEALALINQRLPLFRGDPIAPAGDAGKGEGRHLHWMLILELGRFDAALDERWGSEWRTDRIPEWIRDYRQLRETTIGWGYSVANAHCGMRRDPRTKRPVYVVDGRGLLWP